MNAEWLCYVDGQEYGPYTWPQLVQMAASGNVIPATYVRRHHDSQWYTADQVPGLFAPAAPVSPKLAAHPSPPARPATVSASGAMKKVSTKAAVRAPSTAATADTTAQGSPAAQTPPAGVPATTMPQEIPRGRVAKPNTPQPISTAATPQPVQPTWIPVVKSDAAPGPVALPRPEQESASPVKKKDNHKTLVLALGGAIAGVAILGGGALIWNMNRKPVDPKEKEVAAAPVEISSTEIDPDIASVETNPVDTSTPEPATSPASKSNSKPSQTPANAKASPAADGASAAKVAALTAGIKGWKPADEFGQVGIRGGLMCTKLDAWLAADAEGKRVQVKFQASAAAEGEVNASVAPAAEGAAATPAIAAPAGGGETKYVATEPAPYLFVQVTINNTDVKPRPYGGWNVGESAALLVDDAGKPASLVPVATTPGVKRSPAKDVLPGETLVDTIVFAVPPNSDLNFRFLLPKQAFSARQSGAWGYELDGAALASLAAGPANSRPVPGNPAAPAEAPRPQVAIPIPGVQEEPRPAPPAAEPEMKKPEKPAFNPNGPIPIPGLTDVPEKKPEVPNAEPAPKKK